MLKLRRMTLDYVDDFRREINDFDIVKMTGSVPFPVTRDWVIERFKAKNEAERAGGHANRLVFLGSDLVGDGGYFTNDKGQVEIGYWIAKSFWGRGMATRLTLLIIELARSHGHTGDLHAAHAKDNPASGRVLEKAGFERVGDDRFPSKARGCDVPCWRYVLRPNQLSG